MANVESSMSIFGNCHNVLSNKTIIITMITIVELGAKRADVKIWPKFSSSLRFILLGLQTQVIMSET